jgi:chromosome segregation ATPase
MCNGFLKRRSVLAGLFLMAFAAGPCLGADLAYQSDKLAAAAGSFQAARQQYEQAMGNLVTERQAALKAAKAAPEYQQALQQVDITNEKYKTTLKTATAGLQQNSRQYQDLVKQHNAVLAEIDRVRVNPNTTTEELTSLYEKRFALSAQIRAMDGSAAQAGNADQLKAQWSDATKAVEAMDARMGTQVESAPAVADARAKAEAALKDLDAAGIELTMAQAGYQMSFQQAQQEYFQAQQAQFLQAPQPGVSLTYEVGGDRYGGYRRPTATPPIARPKGR